MLKTRDLAALALAASVCSAGTGFAETAPGGAEPPPLYEGRLAPFAGKTLEQKVQELADREEIRDLTHTYAQRVAHGVSIADLFTDDGVFIETHGDVRQELRGRKALDERFGKMRTPGTTMPMIHNQLISIHGDEATAIASIELRISQNGQSIIASGYYRDKLRREDGRWRFAERDVAFFHWVPIQQGWAKPAAP